MKFIFHLGTGFYHSAYHHQSLAPTGLEFGDWSRGILKSTISKIIEIVLQSFNIQYIRKHFKHFEKF